MSTIKKRGDARKRKLPKGVWAHKTASKILNKIKRNK